jgi:tRNA pseudouridine32 synthase/23S rRNA pseudouridine746 synthase
MAEIGHPILGDPLYGAADCGGVPRMMLHAEVLMLRHPEGGGALSLTAPCPF